jgi:hypothetical protein
LKLAGVGPDKPGRDPSPASVPEVPHAGDPREDLAFPQLVTHADQIHDLPASV